MFSLIFTLTGMTILRFIVRQFVVIFLFLFGIFLLYFKTYWPAGGGRGQNPENTAQRVPREAICPKGGNMSQGRLTWSLPWDIEICDQSALGPYFPDFVLFRLQQANMS